jgi:hypothetical protein
VAQARLEAGTPTPTSLLTTLPSDNALPASALEVLETGEANNIENPGSVGEIAKELAEQRRARSRDQDLEHEAFRAALGEMPEATHQEPPVANLDAEREALRAETERYAELGHRTEAALAEFHNHQQTAAQTHVQQRVAQYEVAFQQEFPEAYSAQAEQELARNNPQRYAELHDRRAQYQRAIKADLFDASVNQQAIAQNQQAQFDRAARHDDAAFDQAHPELQDPRAKERMRAGIYEMFAEQGVSREQLDHLYTTNPAVRSHMGQEAILAAWRQHERAKIMKSRGPTKAPPPPQRPGVHGDAPSRHDRAVSEAMQRLNRTGSIRDAQRALIAKRAAARR